MFLCDVLCCGGDNGGSGVKVALKSHGVMCEVACVCFVSN